MKASASTTSSTIHSPISAPASPPGQSPDLAVLGGQKCSSHRYYTWIFGFLEDHPMTDGYVVNNHGDRFRPQDLGLWDPFQMAVKNGL